MYFSESNTKIIAGDAGLMLASAAVFLGLEQLPAAGQWFAALMALYTLPYILNTRVGA